MHLEDHTVSLKFLTNICTEHFLLLFILFLENISQNSLAISSNTNQASAHHLKHEKSIHTCRTQGGAE